MDILPDVIIPYPEKWVISWDISRIRIRIRGELYKVKLRNILSRIDEKHYFEIRLISYLKNCTFDHFVKVYLAILPCSFCHVYGNIIDFSGYIPGRDFVVSAGNSNPIFINLFTARFLNFQLYRDFLLNIWHLKNHKRKDNISRHSP